MPTLSETKGFFYSGLIPFIGYLIGPDGHHGGHAILTLKQCGIKLTDSLNGVFENGTNRQNFTQSSQ